MDVPGTYQSDVAWDRCLLYISVSLYDVPIMSTGLSKLLHGTIQGISNEHLQDTCGYLLGMQMLI